MSRWCVTGRTIPTLALRQNKRKSAPEAPYAPYALPISPSPYLPISPSPHLPISPSPYSLLPTPYSLLPTSVRTKNARDLR
ncbi:hypothetical protein [Moorena producens]|uniref:hypothetical protein n=1 Tax=Moorena producens TaxID=1155739 RepID=UPI003C710315